MGSFDDFVDAFAGGVDRLWASMLSQVGIVAGVDTDRLSARTFWDATGQDLGDKAFSDYAKEMYGGWWTNKRMPAPVNNVQQVILYRMGRSFMGEMGGDGMMEGIRTAVCPHWNEIGMDDIYTGSSKAEPYLAFHVLLGDVILVQPDAYAQVSFSTVV